MHSLRLIYGKRKKMEEFEKIYRQYFTDVYRYMIRLTGNAELAEEIDDGEEE